MTTLLTSLIILLATAACIVLCAAPLAAEAQTQPAPDAKFPQFKRSGEVTQLYVDGRPFLILGGELGNSTAASAAVMKPIWPRLAALNLNTVLVPVYWELLEPEEGRFDFALVDALLEGARRHDLHLVLLWFGAWKNSMSCYAPPWVKLDAHRFERARTRDGRAIEILSPFCKATLDADASAFAALVRHLREHDGERHTVILVQVENEIGMLPEARDHSPAADAAFAEAVPAELIDGLRAHGAPSPAMAELWRRAGAKTSGTWAAVFGDSPEGEEVFTAWHFARYVNEVVRRGKAEYPLPMFVNAALNRPGRRPGEYPSGGPLPHLLEVWRAGAPQLDMLSPDVYFPNFAEWTERYRMPGNPVFVPEAMRAGRAAANAMYAIAQQNAIGFSPFGIESIDGDDAERLGKTYSALRHLRGAILNQQGTGALMGLSPTIGFDGSVDAARQMLAFGAYSLTVTFAVPARPATDPIPDTNNPALRGRDLPACGGMILWTGADDYIVVGTGLTITHAVTASDREQAGMLAVDEWTQRPDGAWSFERRLNGDQTHQGRHVHLPEGTISMLHVRLYRYR